MALVKRGVRFFSWVAWGLLALTPVGCSRRKGPPELSTSGGSNGGPAASIPRPKSASELPTTRADIYLGNLDEKIAELTRLTLESSGSVLASNARSLAAAHHTRGLFRGDLDELQLGVSLVDRCLAEEPGSALCHLMRAEQEQSLHRFKAARADVERARRLGADPVRVADLEAELDWNAGLHEKAIVAIRGARRERPSSATWMREAQLDHDLGLDEASDKAFVSAERLLQDTSPLPVAHLNVQRGMQAFDRGRLEEACIFFREAVSRMPTYVAANEHLAETLHALGKDDEATAVYERVVALSQDPEHQHSLALLYAASGRRDRARELEIAALARYEQLLTRYPEAMYWHASEFFLAIGERGRALDLLRKNVELRPNSASHVALARAALANDNLADARKAIDVALAMPVRSATLFLTASRVYSRLGDAASADTYLKRARTMNPRIEAAEGAEASGTGVTATPP